MFKEPEIHSSCQFHSITIVKAKIDILTVHCHMVPLGVYSIGPEAVNSYPWILDKKFKFLDLSLRHLWTKTHPDFLSKNYAC